MRRLLPCAVIGLLWLNACRTGGTPAGGEVPPAPARAAVKADDSDPSQIQPAPAPVAAALPRDTQPVQAISGFSLAGAEECVPLAESAACIPRVDALQAACARSKGEVRRCDDCRLLCSRAVLTKAAAGASK